MQIESHMTWEDVIREVRFSGTDDQRDFCGLACAEILDLEHKIAELLHGEDYTDMKFERDFMKLFFKCR